MKIIFLLLFTVFLYASTVPLFFKGNQELSSRELYKVLNLYEPYLYEFYKDKPTINPKTLPILSQTLLNYYKTKGFYHANITYTQDKKSITITINENTPIRIAEITTIANLELKFKIPFKKNDIFDAEKFIQTKKDINLLYANNHYCNSLLDAKAWIDTDTNSAYLIYRVTPNEICHFSEITFNDSPNIDTAIIQSLIYINEGDPYSLETITKSYQNLYSHDGISKALIDTKADKNHTIKTTVTITQNEKPIRTQVGLGISSNEGAMASFGVKHRNLFGNLKTLALNTRVTQIKQTVDISYDMPLVNRETFGSDVGLDNEIFDGFKENRIFGSVYLKQRFNPTALKESLFFDNVTTYASEDQILFHNGSLFVISPKLELSYDTRDKLLDPSQGYFIGSEAMGSLMSNISDATYYKFKLSGGYILPLSSTILATKISFGSLHLYQGDIPASYRFYAGGMDSNRAYSYRKLGPLDSSSNPIGFDSIMETKIEERFPIYGDIKGVVFNDNTFIGQQSIPDFIDGYYSAGVGLRYLTPIGPLAIDFGFDIANPTLQHAFHFHIGESF